jgi:proteasome lid subunit RPN8/RPN11
MRRRHKAGLRLPRALAEQLLAEAAARPGIEVCGLLGGSNGQVTSVYPVDNIASNQACAFLLEPQGQIQAMRSMRERGEELVGIYHSHPHGPAAPSAEDLRLATYPDVYYLIISLAGQSPRLHGFFYDGVSFSPIEVDSKQ